MGQDILQLYGPAIKRDIETQRCCKEDSSFICSVIRIKQKNPSLQILFYNFVIFWQHISHIFFKCIGIILQFSKFSVFLPIDWSYILLNIKSAHKTDGNEIFYIIQTIAQRRRGYSLYFSNIFQDISLEQFQCWFPNFFCMLCKWTLNDSLHYLSKGIN